MKIAIPILLVISITCFADNPIRKGSTHFSGAFSLGKRSSSEYEYMNVGLGINSERFLSKNIGVGGELYLYHSRDDYSHRTDYSITPTITSVTGIFQLPLFVTTGPIIHFWDRGGTNAETSLGWILKSGVYIFATENFFISPYFQYAESPNQYVDQAIEFRISVGHFFHK